MRHRLSGPRARLRRADAVCVLACRSGSGAGARRTAADRAEPDVSGAIRGWRRGGRCCDPAQPFARAPVGHTVSRPPERKSLRRPPFEPDRRMAARPDTRTRARCRRAGARACVTRRAVGWSGRAPGLYGAQVAGCARPAAPAVQVAERRRPVTLRRARTPRTIRAGRAAREFAGAATGVRRCGAAGRCAGWGRADAQDRAAFRADARGVGQPAGPPGGTCPSTKAISRGRQTRLRS
jgi:hypothetical protein